MFGDHERAELYRKLAARLWVIAEERSRQPQRDRLMTLVGKYERLAVLLDDASKSQSDNVLRLPRLH